MEKVYVNSDMKLVGSTILYADENSKLYEDSANTKPVSKETLRDVFLSGTCCVKDDDKIERAITAEDKTTYFMVSTESSSFYSSEYSAT